MWGVGGEPSSSDSSLTTRACPLVDPDRLFQVFFWGQLVALCPFSLQVKHLPSLKHFSRSAGVSLAGATRFCHLSTSIASGSFDFLLSLCHGVEVLPLFWARRSRYWVSNWI